MGGHEAVAHRLDLGAAVCAQRRCADALVLAHDLAAAFPSPSRRHHRRMPNEVGEQDGAEDAGRRRSGPRALPGLTLGEEVEHRIECLRVGNPVVAREHPEPRIRQPCGERPGIVGHQDVACDGALAAQHEHRHLDLRQQRVEVERGQSRQPRQIARRIGGGADEVRPLVRILPVRAARRELAEGEGEQLPVVPAMVSSVSDAAGRPNRSPDGFMIISFDTRSGRAAA